MFLIPLKWIKYEIKIFLLFTNAFVNRNYTQVTTRPQTKSYKAVTNYRGGRVRPANMMIFLKKHILRPANMKLKIPKILFLRVVVLKFNYTGFRARTTSSFVTAVP